MIELRMRELGVVVVTIGLAEATSWLELGKI